MSDLHPLRHEAEPISLSIRPRYDHPFENEMHKRGIGLARCRLLTWHVAGLAAVLILVIRRLR